MQYHVLSNLLRATPYPCLTSSSLTIFAKAFAPLQHLTHWLTTSRHILHHIRSTKSLRAWYSSKITYGSTPPAISRPAYYKSFKSLHLLVIWELWRHSIVFTTTSLSRNAQRCSRICHSMSSMPNHQIWDQTTFWEDLSLDFITGLSPSNDKTVVLEVVDRFSKGAHFGALPTNFTPYKVATLFLDLISKHRGMPQSLVSDRDPIFISRFW